MQFLIAGFVFVLGAIVGSFLNVVALRWNTGLSLGGRSLCFSCGRTLRARELVPLVSFFIQGAKCRTCHAKISWQYPAVEFATGMLFLGLFMRWLSLGAQNFSAGLIDAVFFAVAFSILVVISIYDIKHMIIPDALAYSFAALAFGHLVYTLVAPGSVGHSLASWHDLLAGPLLAVPFAALWALSCGRWMGLGDAKLVLGIGWLLGLDSGTFACMLAFWIGAAGGLIILLWKHTRFKMQSEIPFGPFLALAAFLTLVFNLSFSSLQLAIASYL